MSNLPDDTENLETVYIVTECGQVKGRRRSGIYGDQFYSFEGIPFAELPLGTLRFKAPVPIKSWGCTPLDCTRKAVKPLQHNFFKKETSGDENCLFLNIYVQSFETKNLPVMVYIYGGGFEIGDPTTDRSGPDYFMKQPIVLVTIAYRLGALGFLSLEDPAVDCPGNAGIKDLLLGLKWVKANIKRFNGDEENITIFGNSAGAALISFLSLSPCARGLFHKMILQSGTAFCPWAVSNVRCQPYRLAKIMGYKGPWKDAEILEFLQNADAKEMIKINTLTVEENIRGNQYSFGPVVEPYKSAHCIISHAPEVLITKSWSNGIPLLIGATSFEALFLKNILGYKPFVFASIRRSPSLLLPQNLRRRLPKKKQIKFGEELRKIHFGDKGINVKNVLYFCKYASYALFWNPIHRNIIARQWFSSAPTYVYRFDFDSPHFNLHRLEYCGPNMCGVCHSDDLDYLFYSNSSYKLPTDSLEFLTINRMVEIWTTFARTSKPNCKELKNVQWKAVQNYENEPICCLNISNELFVVTLPEQKKLKVWQSFYKENFDYDEE